jgi:hypothetical protein
MVHLPRFGESFTPQNLRHVLPVHKDIGDEAVVDITTARDDTDGSATEQCLQPLFGCQAVRLAQFRRVDAAEPDALLSDADRISIDGGHLQRAEQPRVSSQLSAQRGDRGLFLLGPQFVAAFGKPLRAAVRRTAGALLFVARQAIRGGFLRRWVPAEIASGLQGRFMIGF